jgi:hypothetical protein
VVGQNYSRSVTEGLADLVGQQIDQPGRRGEAAVGATPVLQLVQHPLEAQLDALDDRPLFPDDEIAQSQAQR